MKLRRPFRSSRSAFATAAVFILLAAASAVMLTTAATFRQLHKELRFVEQKQTQRWVRAAKPPVARTPDRSTNAPPAATKP